MADPKYANLPGIDLNSPDVYETSDLPEDDQAQNLDQEEFGSEGIEKCNVDASQAFDTFKTKSIDSGSTDFSDRVSRTRRTGYDIPLTEYELSESRKDETLQQKYQRLRQEIQELGDEVNKATDAVKSETKSVDKASPVPLTKQVEVLEHQLSDLHLEELLGGQSSVSLVDPQGALQKRLLTELQGYSDKEGTKKDAKKTKEDGRVSYELYYNPKETKFSENAQLAKLEQRLVHVEATLGNNPEKLSLLTSETANKSIVGAVGLLSSKMKLLEPTHLEQIEGRLHALSFKLNQMTEKKQAIVAEEGGEKASQVSELYDLVKKWDSVADSLPHLVDRLTALRELHEQALQFSQALAHLDTTQQQISTNLASHSDMLKQVQSSMTDNMDKIKANCASIDSRVTALK